MFRYVPYYFDCTALCFLFLRAFLPLKKSSAVTLSETSPLASRKYVAKQVIDIPNLPETLRLLTLHCPVFGMNEV